MEFGYQVRLIESGMIEGFDLCIFRLEGKKIFLLQSNGKEIEIENGAYSRENTLHLSTEMLKLLANELQRKGVKPKEASKTEGLYEAQSEHLQDLRKLLKLK